MAALRMGMRAFGRLTTSTLPRLACVQTSIPSQFNLVSSVRQFTTAFEGKVLFIEEHDYAKIEGNIATIGITEAGQDLLGQVTYVDLPEIGTEVDSGDAICAVESVKAVGDVFALVSGTIVEVNTLLEDQPEMINELPETDGWICKIEFNKPEELDALLSREAYDAFANDK
eukprot:m.20655 g.20655  ORF g.20655 m.20655 type:complete len:171 (+) comp13039_c0_seq1:227-739(+)